MQLKINGKVVAAKPGETILQITENIGVNCSDFARKPIAAKIGGEVFSLNYVPVRVADNNTDRSSIRRAMAASNGEIYLICYNDPVGKEVYARTVQFVLFLAIHNLWPDARAKMNCTVGNALYVEVRADGFDAHVLKTEVKRLVDENIPIIRRRVPLAEAIIRYKDSGQHDKARLLSWRTETFFDEYYYGDFADYYYGELAPSTGYMQVWDIIPAEGGFMFLYPNNNAPNQVSSFASMPKFLSVCNEAERWCELMGCETVADLNEMVKDGKIRQLIRVNEALHEKQFSQVADMVCASVAKAVMLAGPSSSGKTTSANRLATQLRVHGKKPILMSLDDYYMDREKIKPGLDGKIDLEHIDTLDTDLFRMHLQQLLQGESVSLPSFNFKTGKREWHGESLQLDESSIVIIEGLHALNPSLLPKDMDERLVFKLYVSALLPLNLDDHNRIPTSSLRLLRRTVRDYTTRGASVQQTMSMWDSVRRGEARWIFPYQETADVILNSSTIYELAVLKKHIFPLLTAIEPEDACYEQVRSVVKILNYVLDADVDDEIPPTSIVREFIGGNTFYR